LGKNRKNFSLSKENHFGLSVAIDTYGEIVIRRDLELIYSIEKEKNENLQKELENY